MGTFDSHYGKRVIGQEKVRSKLLQAIYPLMDGKQKSRLLFCYMEIPQDLLAIDSNVLLFDEFDKALSVFHSAFYQLFDEGIYEDHNYKVTVDKAIIVCTSNYKTVDEVKENLGLPIYNRFDSIIKFDELSNEAKKKIAELEIERLKTDFNIEDNKLFEKLKEAAITASNAREIKHLVKDTFSLLAIRKICSDAEE